MSRHILITLRVTMETASYAWGAEELETLRDALHEVVADHLGPVNAVALIAGREIPNAPDL